MTQHAIPQAEIKALWKENLARYKIFMPLLPYTPTAVAVSEASSKVLRGRTVAYCIVHEEYIFFGSRVLLTMVFGKDTYKLVTANPVLVFAEQGHLNEQEIVKAELLK